MPAPIPVVMRERIIALYDQGKKTRHVVAAVGYCKSAVRRVRQHHRERGTVRPRVPVRPSGLTPAVSAELGELVSATPDATLAELAAALASPEAKGKGKGKKGKGKKGKGKKGKVTVEVSPSTVDRWLSKLGLTLKKSRTGPPSRTAPTWPRPGRRGRPRWPAAAAAAAAASTPTTS